MQPYIALMVINSLAMTARQISMMHLVRAKTQFKVAQDRADIIKFIDEIYLNYQSWKKQE